MFTLLRKFILAVLADVGGPQYPPHVVQLIFMWASELGRIKMYSSYDMIQCALINEIALWKPSINLSVIKYTT